MTREEYFAQDRYFSESAQELIDISFMEFPHAFYAHRKLLYEERDAYMGTTLSNAFVRYLFPSGNMCQELLRSHGSVAHGYYNLMHAAAVRGKLYRAAARVGVRVTTHKDHKGWMTAKVVVDTTVRVRGEEVSV